MKSQRIKKSHRASPYDVENAPRRQCMTTEQLAILVPYYAKNAHPTVGDIKLLAEEIDRPVQKVVNWFNNRRAKENRLERDSSQKQPPLSQNFSMSGDDDSKYESGDAQGAIGQEGLDHEVVDQEAQEAIDQEARASVAAMANMSPEEINAAFIDVEIHAARACVAAMAKMTPDEVNAAFILSNLKRRIIVHPPQRRQSDVFSSV